MRVRRIELRSRPWQGRVLPLNHTRITEGLYSTRHKRQQYYFCAPGGIRTPNNSFEGWHDIHFTTGASEGQSESLLSFSPSDAHESFVLTGAYRL